MAVEVEGYKTRVHCVTAVRFVGEGSRLSIANGAAAPAFESAADREIDGNFAIPALQVCFSFQCIEMISFQRFLARYISCRQKRQADDLPRNVGTIRTDAVHIGTIDNQNARRAVAMRAGLAFARGA